MDLTSKVTPIRDDIDLSTSATHNDTDAKRTNGGGGGGDDMGARIQTLESDMKDVKAILGRLEPMIVRIDERLTSTLPHLATKAQLSAVESGLADKPSRTYMWVVVGVLIGGIFAAITLGAYIVTAFMN